MSEKLEYKNYIVIFKGSYGDSDFKKIEHFPIATFSPSLARKELEEAYNMEWCFVVDTDSGKGWKVE